MVHFWPNMPFLAIGDPQAQKRSPKSTVNYDIHIYTINIKYFYAQFRGMKHRQQLLVYSTFSLLLTLFQEQTFNKRLNLSQDVDFSLLPPLFSLHFHNCGPALVP